LQLFLVNFAHEDNLMAKVQKKKKPTRTTDNTSFLLEQIIEGAKEKKASNIVMLDLTKISNRVADYYIVCNADNIRQVAAIADSVEEFTTKHCEEKPWHVEGLINAQWVLMDYVNVVVHVFETEARDFYGIEHLWADAVITKIKD
jgi:ribosome-associated protein